MKRVLGLMLAVSTATQAQAQTSPAFDLEPLRLSSSATDGLVMEAGRVAEPQTVRVGLTLGYARGSLLYELTDGSRHWMVRDRVQTWVTAAWSPLQRLEVSAQLPVTVWQGAGPGPALLPVASAGLGTPQLGARYALLEGPLSLGAGLDVGLPGGSTEALNAQGEWAGLQLAPRVSVGHAVGDFLVGGSVALRLRGEVAVPGAAVGNTVEAQLGVTTALSAARVELVLQGSRSLVSPLTVIELIAGARLPLAHGVETYAAVGKGFTDAPGSPSWRALAGVAWTRLGERPPQPVTPLLTEADPCAERPSAEGCAPVVAQAEAPADRDGDSVPDAVDNCPEERGPASNQGCPEAEKQLVKIERDRLRPTEEVSFADERVLFPLGEATIEGEWARALKQIAQLLQRHPEITHLRIEGHTDNTGPDDFNMRLSQERADAVRSFLVAQGVAAGRLTSHGFGPTRPVASNANAEGRQANRRVEFIIAERVPEKR